MTDRDVIDAKVDLIDERLTLLKEERTTLDPDEVDRHTVHDILNEDLNDVQAFVRQIYAHLDATE